MERLSYDAKLVVGAIGKVKHRNEKVMNYEIRRLTQNITLLDTYLVEWVHHVKTSGTSFKQREATEYMYEALLDGCMMIICIIDTELKKERWNKI